MATSKYEKATDNAKLACNDACGVSLGMELIGERWTLIILRELLYGPRRFKQLRGAIPGVTASVLSQRLERLEAVGALIRRQLPPPASVQVYELTDWGRASEAMMAAVGRWAIGSPMWDPSLPLNETSLMMSFRSLLDPKRAKGLNAEIGFVIGEEQFVTHLHNGVIDVARAEVSREPLVFRAQKTAPIAAAVLRGVPLQTLEASGELEVSGDRGLADRFVTLFPSVARA